MPGFSQVGQPVSRSSSWASCDSMYVILLEGTAAQAAWGGYCGRAQMLMAAEASGEATCAEPGDPLDDPRRGEVDEAASIDRWAEENAGRELPVHGGVRRIHLGEPRTGADELAAVVGPVCVIQSRDDV